MPDVTLVVPVEEVARRAGLCLPLTGEQRQTIEDTLIDVQADVEAYLGRPITPASYTDTGVWPAPDGWDLVQWPVVAVLSATVEVDPITNQATGRYTITYLAGLDAANPDRRDLEPIRRYVRAAAATRRLVLNLRDDAGSGLREISSLSAEGQSVSYATTAASRAAPNNEPGEVPSIETLDGWRIAGREVYQRPGLASVTGVDPQWAGWPEQWLG